MRRAVLVALALVPGLAHAEEAYTPHANAGLEVLGSGEALSVAFRARVGVARSFGGGPVRPQLGIGAMAGFGVLAVDDPRALDGAVNLGYADYGPELQFGVRWVDGGIVDTRLFASFAPLRIVVDDRLKLDAIRGVVDGHGYRFAIGGSWAGYVIRSWTDRGDAEALLGFVLPQQLEFVVERGAGSTRFGIAVAYGI